MMERLTSPSGIAYGGYRLACIDRCDKVCHCICDELSDVVRRLGQYEDTGMTPAEVRAIAVNFKTATGWIDTGGRTVKEIKHYICDVCKTVYASKADAYDCESNHKAPVSIVSTRSLSKTQDATGYPVTITVKMSDGKQVVYKR